jgi:hypothetical protein
MIGTASNRSTVDKHVDIARASQARLILPTSKITPQSERKRR